MNYKHIIISLLVGILIGIGIVALVVVKKDKTDLRALKKLNEEITSDFETIQTLNENLSYEIEQYESLVSQEFSDLRSGEYDRPVILPPPVIAGSGSVSALSLQLGNVHKAYARYLAARDSIAGLPPVSLDPDGPVPR